MTEPDAQPAEPPVEDPAPVDEPEPVDDGKGHLVGAPPFALPEDEGGQAAVVGHPDVPAEALPLVNQPEPSEEQAQPEADAAG